MNYPIRNSNQEKFLLTMRGWIKAKNSRACKKFVEEMGQNQNADALPALMELLRLPSGVFWQRRPTAEMCEAREAAVHAIAQIGASDALSCIGVALFNPCPGVRAAASQILSQAGTNAADPLARLMTWKQNWSVEGMRVLLYTLGSTRNPNAGPPLARVLMGELPVAPPRWEGHILLTLTWMTAAEVLGLAAFLSAFGVNLFIGLTFILTLGIFFSLMNLMVVLPVRNSKFKQERRSLALAACESLRILGDKKALPALMAAARRWETDIAGAAKGGVATLLPLLRADDAEWLPLTVRLRLMEMLSAPDPLLTFPLLSAMEHIGTGAAVHSVGRLMSKGITPDIRAEAARIYPLLTERAKQEKVSGTLLRASQSPTQNREELLRPAASNPKIASEELLRATLGQSE